MGLGFFKRLILGEDANQQFGKKSFTPKKNPALKSEKSKKKYQKTRLAHEIVEEKPYLYARPVCRIGHASFGSDGQQYYDARVGGRPEQLNKFDLPPIDTPEGLAEWLGVPLRTLVWLTNYYSNGQDEQVLKKQHYHYSWLKKKSGPDYRLIEAPKPLLKHCQLRVLRGILDFVPPHSAAQAFRKRAGIFANAKLHCGKYVVLKADLRDFYPSISIKRVNAVFKGMGYNAEVARWLARLCTNRIPYSLKGPSGASASLLGSFRGIHLPQGASTSPALANLSAWAMDVRLSGLARKFQLSYSRYADDLTFSGGKEFMAHKNVNAFIPYLRAIVKNERFVWMGKKFNIIRSGSRQVVTGLTVNEKPNVSRKMYQNLRATLFNCVRHGAVSQNREQISDFKGHLAGKIAFVCSINPGRGEKLKKLFQQIGPWE